VADSLLLQEEWKYCSPMGLVDPFEEKPSYPSSMKLVDSSEGWKYCSPKGLVEQLEKKPSDPPMKLVALIPEKEEG